MGLISALFHKAPITQFAAQLAEEIAKRYPQHVDADSAKRPSVNRLTRIVEDACKKARAFQDEHQLGWVGKAKLGVPFGGHSRSAAIAKTSLTWRPRH